MLIRYTYSYICSKLTFMCFLRELGWVYDLSQPDIRQLYGLSEVCTCECFFRSELLANLRSHPSYSHLNGFSPVKTPTLLLQLGFVCTWSINKITSNDQLQCSKTVKRSVQWHDNKFTARFFTRIISDGESQWNFSEQSNPVNYTYTILAYLSTTGRGREKKGRLETLKILGLEPFFSFFFLCMYACGVVSCYFWSLRFTCITRIAHKSYSK